MTLSNYCFMVVMLAFFFSSSKATKFRAQQKVTGRQVAPFLIDVTHRKRLKQISSKVVSATGYKFCAMAE